MTHKFNQSQTQTKAGRMESRQYQFDSLTKSGYLKTEYKNLVIFSHPTELLLKTFWGTAANHTDFFRYRTSEQLAAKIESLKESADSREKWKAEQKEKNKGKSSSHASASAAIKQELTAAFPGIKFSVTSDSFSMGDSVHIKWTDGPTTDEVDNISKKYQYGHFDGMTDMYESSNMRNDIPQSKYVSSSRSISDETEAILLPDAEKYFRADHYSNVRNVNDFLRRVFYHSSIPTGATVTGIEPTGENCGLSVPERFYRIAYTLPESAVKQAENTPQIKEIEVKQGEVNIIEYGKGIAVIGDTRPIKDKLKALGGRFNFRLTCGPGWVFQKSKLAEITAALTAEPEPDTLQTEIQKTVEFFEETDKKIYGEVTEQTKVIKMLQSPVKEYDNLQDIEAAANNGEVISLLNLCELVNHK